MFNSSEASTGRTLTALLDSYLRSITTRPARPGVWYAVAGRTDSSRIYQVHVSTATLTPVGTPRFGELVGARIDRRGTIWGLANVGGWELLGVDGETGRAYPRVKIKFPSGAPTDFKGIDFSPSGILYVGSVDGRIYTIDVETGAATLAVSSKLSISGLAFDPLTGALWACPRSNPTIRDRLYKLDLSTGDTLGTGNTGFNQPMSDLAFDASGNLFGLVGNPASGLSSRLARIDKGTGVGTDIGPVAVPGMVGIAYSPTSGAADVENHATSQVVTQFELSQNYPNPFNPKTQIEYQVSGPGLHHVRISVHDLLGREVAVLADRRNAAGRYAVTFDASHLSSGTYLYRLTAGESILTRRMTLVK